MTRVWVLSATLGQRRRVENLLTKFGASTNWKLQRFAPATHQTIFELEIDIAWLVSELAKIGCVFEAEGPGERFLFLPALGVHRQELDDAGEPVIRFGHLKNLLSQSAGSLAEFERRLRIAEGVPWLDLLEPYRIGQSRTDSLPRAI